ncbi:MAG: acyl-CoA dehydrogenase family protein, partial [Polyangiaceae bacterium]|nr:acyl-CoA dehydrogenase family protein [Polyangiaceae bacterium]
MHFKFSEEQEELRRAARRFLEAESTPEKVRRVMATETGVDADVWARVAEELGWLAVTIPEEHGGLGLDAVDLMPILEEMGRSLFCGPFFSTICLGANALLLGASEAQKSEYLPAIAAGSLTATLAHTERNGRWDASGIEATFERSGDEYVLSGEKRYVLDGHTAGLVIFAARAEGSRGDEGVSLFALPGDTPGLERAVLPTMDQTRKQASMRLDRLRVPRHALLGHEGDGARVLAKTIDRALAALAVEQVGGAEACLDMAVAYAKERKQFGRAIGTFQSIKHTCANMLMRTESARSIAYFAGLCAAEDSTELAEVAASAKAYCSDAYFFCAA